MAPLALGEAPGSRAFERAAQAFRAGDYGAALQGFLAARRAGVDTPQLRYNLGVTYYRLGRYAEAQDEFEALTREPAWAPLARYNLGLTAQRMGRAKQAAEHYERARQTSGDPKLRTLAGAALNRLPVPPSAPGTSAIASLAAGYDSNVTLSPGAEIAGFGDEEDFFVEALAAASHRVHGTSTRALYLYGAIALRKHMDVERFDHAGLRVGANREAVSGAWLTGAGGYVEYLELDGNELQHAMGIDLHARRPLEAGGDMRGRYQLALVEGGGGFGYLEGWQQRLSLDGALSPALRAGYELELNDREDLRRGAEFASFSPTRHSLFLLAELSDVAGWRTEARGEYRFSRYNDEHRLAGGEEIRREDDRYGASLRLSRPAANAWRLFLRYDYYRNDSTIEVYEYRRHQLMAGIEAIL